MIVSWKPLTSEFLSVRAPQSITLCDLVALLVQARMYVTLIDLNYTEIRAVIKSNIVTIMMKLKLTLELYIRASATFL